MNNQLAAMATIAAGIGVSRLIRETLGAGISTGLISFAAGGIIAVTAEDDMAILAGAGLASDGLVETTEQTIERVLAENG